MLLLLFGLRSKNFLPLVVDNSIWQVGNGHKVNYWLDCWLSKSVVPFFEIREQLHSHLSTNLSDYISTGMWHFLIFFPMSLGITKALHTELYGAIVAIEISHLKLSKKLWLESDLSLVVAYL